MGKAKKQSLKKLLLPLILLGIAAFVFLALSVPGTVKLVQGPEDLDYVEYDESQPDGGLSGKYVEGTLYAVYGWYCETTNGDSTVSREYIIDADSTYYMGMLVKKSGIDEAEALYEACDQYLGGTGDVTDVYAVQYTVRGTIHPMSGSSKSMYYTYLENCGVSTADQAYFLPYYLEIGVVGDSSPAATLVMLFIAIALIGIMILLIVRWANGSYQKEISAYLAANGNSEQVRAQVNAFFDSTEGQRPIRCDQEFISAQPGASTMFRRAEELVWVYKKAVTRKLNFITVGHSYYAVLAFLDGVKYEISLKNENAVNELLQRLCAMYPRIVGGYTDELERLFGQNREAFLRLRYYPAAAQYTQSVNVQPEAAAQPWAPNDTQV